MGFRNDNKINIVVVLDGNENSTEFMSTTFLLTSTHYFISHLHIQTYTYLKKKKKNNKQTNLQKPMTNKTQVIRNNPFLNFCIYTYIHNLLGSNILL